MSPTRVAIVGAGVIGHRHAAAVRANGDLVAAVTDADRDRATAFAAEYDAIALADAPLGALAEHAEAAVVASPSPLHQQQAEALLMAGLDVLLEKPHRVPGEDPARLATAVRESGRRCFVGMTTRHSPGIRAVTQAVRSGRLGALLAYEDDVHFRLAPGDLPDWYFDPRTSGGGVLLTNGVHALDRARAIVGDLTPVSARLRILFPEHATEDAAELRLEAPDGVPVSISALWAPYEVPAASLRIRGTAGTAIALPDGSYRIADAAGIETGDPVGDDVSFAAQWRAFRAGAPGFAVEDLEPTLALIEDVYRRWPIAA